MAQKKFEDATDTAAVSSQTAGKAGVVPWFSLV